MHYSSNKSKGYTPISSGPNRSGFYMGPQGNLLSMMQTGGMTRGGAALAQATQRQSDIKKLEAAQRREAKRQQKGGIFGSVGSLAGGLLGAALAPVTGGASLAIASGLGSALGKGLGERIGAGKAQSVDRTGTIFNQEDFRGVGRASKDFNRGMLGRAGISGITTALTAGFSPTGGMYGATARKVGSGGLGTLGARLREGSSLIGKGLSRFGYTGASSKIPQLTQASMDFRSAVMPSILSRALDYTKPNNPQFSNDLGSQSVSQFPSRLDREGMYF